MNKTYFRLDVMSLFYCMLLAEKHCFICESVKTGFWWKPCKFSNRRMLFYAMKPSSTLDLTLNPNSIMRLFPLLTIGFKWQVTLSVRPTYKYIESPGLKRVFCVDFRLKSLRGKKEDTARRAKLNLNSNDAKEVLESHASNKLANKRLQGETWDTKEPWI